MLRRVSLQWQTAAVVRLHYARRQPASILKLTTRRAASTAAAHSESADFTRNIGIIAHIDAGKTTTTERMLFYSGFTRRIGDVDDGSTITDFLPAERARGITIQSAAISFNWPPSDTPEKTRGDPTAARSTQSHDINLIDTPGHADFTFEVVRSLRILDGAICILDGVAGVEAQTEKVWTQANAHKIPRIIYVNKLDRDGASFTNTVKAVAAKLNGWPAVCQIPWWGVKDDFIGIGDVVHARAMRWDSADGKSVKSFSLEELETVSAPLAKHLRDARVALVELLSEHDDQIVEDFFEHDEDHLAVPPARILASLRRCVLRGTGEVIPVFAGASFRNIGVQPLLDAVNELLPSPLERPTSEISIVGEKSDLKALLSGGFAPSAAIVRHSKGKPKRGSPSKEQTKLSVHNLEGCALAFKVVNDPKRGVLVYVRVYSGALNANSMLFNTNLQTPERAQRLLKMYASDAVEIPSLSAGQIGVISGLKFARTGDTLLSYRGMSKAGPPQPLNQLQLKPIEVPPAVFFASVEPNSLSEEKHLKECLQLLLREDPSLHVSMDDETGQTLLSGMGELHLEIARDRLINDFKAKAEIGKIEVGYRECLTSELSQTSVYDREIDGKRAKAGCQVTLEPLPEGFDLSEATEIGGNVIQVTFEGDLDSDETSHFSKALDETELTQSLINGAVAALSRGPRLSFPMHDTLVRISIDPRRDFFSEAESSTSAFSSAAHLAVRTALKSAETKLMEPVMNVNIAVDEEYMGRVTQDIASARGGQVTLLDDAGNEDQNSASSQARRVDVSKVWTPPDRYASSGTGTQTQHNRPRTVTARVPLKEMVGYLKHLRSLTAGRGTFVMNIDRFEIMNARREKAVLEEMRGWR